MIRSARSLGADLALRAEVCVIGSGAGGAVAAAELSAGGRDVVVLEAGPHWTKQDFTQREDEMLPRLFEEAGMRQTADGAITVLQGRCIGGSTVHNLCYCFRTPDPILALWRDEHGLPELTPAALEPSFGRVEAGLQVKQIREDEVNALNRIIRRGTQALGWSGFVTRHNRENCVQSGYCILGCSYDAKRSMLVTYVPRADAAGARIWSDAQVERIEAAGGRVRRVHARAAGASGPGPRITVEAPVVVLAAGAVATPDLLLRSRLANRSGWVGRGLHLHPSVMVAGFFEEPIHAYRGIPQSWYVDEFIDLERDPHQGYVLMPITGFPALEGTQLPGFGRDHFRWMRQFAHTAGLLVMLHDRSEGSVESGPSLARPRLRYTLERDDERQLAEGLVHCCELLLAAGAREVLVPYLDEPLVVRPGDDLRAITRRGAAAGTIPIASTHPQSSCRMGGDPRRSVVNAWGECHELPGLFVADMSVFPTSLGAPPQITTAALADRTARHVLERWPAWGR
ncbi:MAG: GMC family oxidoreductase [Deltaproteobacteria bacterium]|nr:GMC family oxidoreductase [Deltaproteobacteria bacterium]